MAVVRRRAVLKNTNDDTSRAAEGLTPIDIDRDNMDWESNDANHAISDFGVVDSF